MTDLPARAEFDHPPRPLAQRLGAILWPSFFAAGVTTMVFFAFVDPLDLRDITLPDLQISREAGYTIAFFLFWIATASSSLFTWILLRPASRFNKPLRQDAGAALYPPPADDSPAEGVRGKGESHNKPLPPEQ